MNRMKWASNCLYVHFSICFSSTSSLCCFFRRRLSLLAMNSIVIFIAEPLSSSWIRLTIPNRLWVKLINLNSKPIPASQYTNIVFFLSSSESWSHIESHEFERNDNGAHTKKAAHAKSRISHCLARSRRRALIRSHFLLKFISNRIRKQHIRKHNSRCNNWKTRQTTRQIIFESESIQHSIESATFILWISNLAGCSIHAIAHNCIQKYEKSPMQWKFSYFFMEIRHFAKFYCRSTLFSN